MSTGIPAREIEAALRKSDDKEALQAFRDKLGPEAVPAQKQAPSSMKIHIELTRKDADGNGVCIVADLADQPALYEFERLYGKYMPRKKILGII